MSCSVCNHPQRQSIDSALLNRTATLAQLSQQHHLSTSALHRHKQHLLQKMARVQNRFQDLLREGYLLILNEFLEQVQRVVATASAEGNTRLLLQAVRQGTGILKFMAKLDPSLTAETVHGLLASPQWAAPGSLLPTAPQFVAGSRQALAHSLLAPCPAPGSPEEALVNSPLPEAVLSQLVAGPGGDPHPAGWEKGGKNSAQKINHYKYQQDKPGEKIFGSDFAGLAKTRPGANGNPKFVALLQECADQGKIPADLPLSEFIYEQSRRAGQTDKKLRDTAAGIVHRPEKGNGSVQMGA
jgi:hypothetical protein